MACMIDTWQPNHPSTQKPPFHTASLRPPPPKSVVSATGISRSSRLTTMFNSVFEPHPSVSKTWGLFYPRAPHCSKFPGLLLTAPCSETTRKKTQVLSWLAGLYVVCTSAAPLSAAVLCSSLWPPHSFSLHRPPDLHTWHFVLEATPLDFHMVHLHFFQCHLLKEAFPNCSQVALLLYFSWPCFMFFHST